MPNKLRERPPSSTINTYEKQDANNGADSLHISLCSGMHTAFRLISFFELIDA